MPAACRLPVKVVIDHNTFRYDVRVVARVERFVGFKRIRLVCQEEVLGILEFSRHRLCVWIDQELMLIESQTVCGLNGPRTL